MDFENEPLNLEIPSFKQAWKGIKNLFQIKIKPLDMVGWLGAKGYILQCGGTAYRYPPKIQIELVQNLCP